MKINSIKNICTSFIGLLIIFTPLNAVIALTSDWISVPKSQYGEQLWDKSSVEKNEDGSIRVLNKFIPKTTNEII